MRYAVVAALVLFAVPCVSQEAGVPLVQHRAIYDLTLDQSAGARNLESAQGRFVVDFMGDACAGYTSNTRLVAVLETGENSTTNLDLRQITFEDGEGRGYRFKTEEMTDGAPSSSIDGDAETGADGRISVRLRAPKPDRFELPAGTLYPTVHTKRLLAAARAGDRTLQAPVFDGTDEKVHDTLAVIGRRIEPGAGDGLEDAAKQQDLTKYARWPVTLSYFAPGNGERTPAAILSFELYENGVSRALKLDYGDYALLGNMTRLEILPDKGDCAKP